MSLSSGLTALIPIFLTDSHTFYETLVILGVAHILLVFFVSYTRTALRYYHTLSSSERCQLQQFQIVFLRMFVVERLHELQIWLLTAIEFLPPTWWLLPGIIRSVEWKLSKLGTVSREGPLPCDTPWPEQPGCQWFCNAELIEPRNNAKR